MSRAAAAVVTLAGHAWLAHGVVRGDLGGTPGLAGVAPVAAVWIALVVAWGVLLRDADGPRTALGYAALVVAARAVAWPAMPALSDDVWRYVWDGELAAAGLDPWRHPPRVIWQSANGPLREQLAPLWPRLNSPDYATVYPPVSQACFRVAAGLTATPGHAVLLWKAAVVAADLGVVACLHRLSRRAGAPPWAAWAYGLHPLVIVEHAGNGHAEALAILGLVLALALLDRGRAASAGLGVALAIGVKLLPALILPFVPRRLAPRAAVVFLASTTAATALLLGPLALDADQILSSLRLYYDTFSFNDGVHGLLAWAWGAPVGRALAVVTALLLGGAALAERSPTRASLPHAWLLALAAYQLLATTVHPWYLTPLIALAGLTRLRFAHVWGVLAPLTYVTYWVGGESALVVGVEYAIVGAVLAVDLLALSGLTLDRVAHGPAWLRGWARRTVPPRVAIKLGLVTPHLPPGATVLDVGSGHGGLCRALRARGWDVTPTDLRDVALWDDVRPVRADATALPFDDDGFDVVLLITMLHHTPDPDAVLREAVRVARARVVVMEDVYTSAWQRRLTWATDALVNLELAGHPHTNRDDTGWRAAFDALGWRVVDHAERRTLWLFRQAVYVLAPPTITPGSRGSDPASASAPAPPPPGGPPTA